MWNSDKMRNKGKLYRMFERGGLNLNSYGLGDNEFIITRK